MRRISTLTLGLLVLGAELAPGVARAEDKKLPLVGQPAVRHRIELRKRRFEVTAQMAVSLNQDFRHFVGGGLVLDFHINDWLGIALQAAGGGAIDSGLGSAVNEKLIPEEDKNARPGETFIAGDGTKDHKSLPYGDEGRPKFQPTREQYNAHLGSINLLTSLYAQVTPFAGKVSIFGALYLRYDMYAMAGFGLMNITNSWGSYNNSNKDSSAMCTTGAAPDPNKCDPLNDGIKAAFMWGVGVHLYFNKWLGLNLELRDFVASTNMGGLDVNGDRNLNRDDASVSNNLFAGVGLTFMLPLNPKLSD